MRGSEGGRTEGAVRAAGVGDWEWRSGEDGGVGQWGWGRERKHVRGGEMGKDREVWVGEERERSGLRIGVGRLGTEPGGAGLLNLGSTLWAPFCVPPGVEHQPPCARRIRILHMLPA